MSLRIERVYIIKAIMICLLSLFLISTVQAASLKKVALVCADDADKLYCQHLDTELNYYSTQSLFNYNGALTNFSYDSITDKFTYTTGIKSIAGTGFTAAQLAKYDVVIIASYSNTFETTNTTSLTGNASWDEIKAAIAKPYGGSITPTTNHPIATSFVFFVDTCNGNAYYNSKKGACPTATVKTQIKSILDSELIGNGITIANSDTGYVTMKTASSLWAQRSFVGGYYFSNQVHYFAPFQNVPAINSIYVQNNGNNGTIIVPDYRSGVVSSPKGACLIATMDSGGWADYSFASQDKGTYNDYNYEYIFGGIVGSNWNNYNSRGGLQYFLKATLDETGSCGYVQIDKVPDHYEFDFAPKGITCASQAVTIKACANASCSALITEGDVRLNLSPSTQLSATGEWINYSCATGDASCQTLTGNVNSLVGNTISFKNGQGIVGLRRTTIGTTDLAIQSDSYTVLGATSSANASTVVPLCFDLVHNAIPCQIEFSDIAMTLTPNLANGIANKPLTPLTLSVIMTSTSNPTQCEPFTSQSIALSFWTDYVNPNTNPVATLMHIDYPNSASTTKSLAVPQRNASMTSIYLDNNGQAKLIPTYSDAGTVRLNVSFNGDNTTMPDTSGIALTIGGLYSFRPYGFCMDSNDVSSGVWPTAMNNNSDNDAYFRTWSGASTYVVGTPFHLTMTPKGWWAGAVEPKNSDPTIQARAWNMLMCQSPSVTPNFCIDNGQNSCATNQIDAMPLTNSIIAPLGGRASSSALANYLPTQGALNGDVLSEEVNEAGVFEFSLPSSIYQSMIIPATISNPLGVFIPEKLAVTEATILDANNPIGKKSFTYMDQPGITVDFKVVAQGLNGSITQNYGLFPDDWRQKLSLIDQNNLPLCYQSLLGGGCIARLTQNKPQVFGGLPINTDIDSVDNVASSPWINGEITINYRNLVFNKQLVVDNYSHTIATTATIPEINQQLDLVLETNQAIAGYAPIAVDYNHIAALQVHLGTLDVRYGRIRLGVPSVSPYNVPPYLVKGFFNSVASIPVYVEYCVGHNCAMDNTEWRVNSDDLGISTIYTGSCRNSDVTTQELSVPSINLFQGKKAILDVQSPKNKSELGTNVLHTLVLGSTAKNSIRCLGNGDISSQTTNEYWLQYRWQQNDAVDEDPSVYVSFIQKSNTTGSLDKKIIFRRGF